jgi:hypothetical protein
MSNNAFSRGLTHVENGGFDTTTTLLTTINASGTGSEGDWSEVIASTDADADTLMMFFYLSSGGGAVDEVSIDIGVGASASETVVIENVPFSGRVITVGEIDVMTFPVQIPAGSRVAARANGDSAVVMGIGIMLYKGSEKSFAFSGAKGFGISANFGGTAVDSGGTANTKGSWVELDAATSDTIRGFWVHLGHNENLTVNAATGDMTDIGIGGSGSEQVIVSNHFQIVNTSESPLASVFYDIEIPAGTRIAARRQCSDTDATDRVRTVALVGII